MAVGRCPQCDGKLDIPKKHSGKQICCAHCQHIFVAPSYASEPSNPAQASAMVSAVSSLPLPNAIRSDASGSDEHVATESSLEKSDTDKLDSIDQNAWPPGMSAPSSPANRAMNDPTTQPAAIGSVAKSLEAKSPAAKNPAAMDPPATESKTSPSIHAMGQPATTAKPSPSLVYAAPQTSDKELAQKEKIADAEPATKKQSRTVKIRRPQAESRSPEAKLPSLNLTDKPRRKQIEMPGWKSNPIFLGVLFCVSMIASAAILLVDVEPPKQLRKTNSEARVRLQEFYEVRPGSDPEPYQSELRSAQLAHSRGDRKAELGHYRNVMTYLRAEDRNPYTGLTGSRERDAELESYLSGLLRDPD